MNATTASLLRKTLITAGILFIVLAFATALSPGTIADQTGSNEHSACFPLKYLERGIRLSTPIDPGKQEVKFRVEPPFDANDTVLRRALRVGDGEKDFIGLAANITAGILYLDLNRNLDLTDDPNGVFRAANQRISSNISLRVCLFRDVRLNLGDAGREHPYLLDFIFLGENYQASIRSGYQGEIELNGKKSVLMIQDNLDGRLDTRDKLLLLPANQQPDSTSVLNRQMPVPRNLFLEGRQYQLDFQFSSGSAPLILTITERTPPMGEIVLDPQLIRRLCMLSAANLVVFDSPGRRISVPADSYRIQQLSLETAPGRLGLLGTSNTPVVEVRAGGSAQLKLGPPFLSTVTVTRVKDVLQLQYVLKGASGERYTFVNTKGATPPKFAIYRGDRQIAVDSFKFG